MENFFHKRRNRFTSDKVASARNIYEKLPKDSSRAVLIVGSSNHRASDHFPADKIFCIADIMELEPTGLAFNRERLDSMLGGIPKPEKKKPDARARGKNIEALQKFLEDELKSAWSFYCNRNDKNGGPQKYPRLTLETLAAGIGSTKGTVSKIFNERKNGKPRYPLLKVLWDSLETEDGVMAYGRSHFRQPQRKN